MPDQFWELCVEIGMILVDAVDSLIAYAGIVMMALSLAGVLYFRGMVQIVFALLLVSSVPFLFWGMLRKAAYQALDVE